MESRQIVGLRQSTCSKEELTRMDLLDAGYLLNSLSMYEEGERKVATRQTRAIMQLDVWTMSTSVNYARAVGLCRLSRNVSVAITGARQPSTSERETTRSNAIAHVIYTNRTNRFCVNYPARRTHRHFVQLWRQSPRLDGYESHR